MASNLFKKALEKMVTTFYAPAERDADSLVMEQSRFVESNPLFKAVIDTFDGYLFILNNKRQILAANRKCFEDFKIELLDELVGLRPGELLRCIHACEGPGGCGTSEACASCGAVNSILNSQRDGQPSVCDCFATLKKNGCTQAREFRARSTPFRIASQEFTVMVLSDISGVKRREALERTFFHDVLNTLGGLMGWCEVLQETSTPETRRVVGRIAFLAHRLKDEIEDNRRLNEAERGTLLLNKKEHAVGEILSAVGAVFEAHDVARERVLEIAAVDPGEAIMTDFTLLLRVLANMVKNALEAVPEGGRVQLWFTREADGAVFRVHNNGAIDKAVRPRVFERYYSTKPESGRGIGTYSMKLFGERYLGGKVGFESSPEQGTTFYIRLANA